MKIFNLSEKVFSELEKLTLGNGIVNTMAELYHMPKDSDEILLIFKMFHSTDETYLADKIKTITSLMEQERNYAIPALVYPKGLVTIEDELYGYAMPYIKGTNLKVYMNDPKVSFDKKRNALIQIGRLLEEMKKVREETPFTDFYLNDIHESNFIVDNQTGKVKFVDIDSCSINGNILDRSMYQRPVSKFRNMPEKYPTQKDGYFGTYLIPSDDTEIYSYNSMILNLIAGENIGCLNPGAMLDYIAYLEGLNYPFEFLCDLISMYSTTKPSRNPVDNLESLEYNPESTFYKYIRSPKTF